MIAMGNQRSPLCGNYSIQYYRIIGNYSEYIAATIRHKARFPWYTRRMEQSEISRILIEKRKKLRITKTCLSQLTGISRTQIYNIEHNLKSPSVETLAKLCNELGLVVSVTERQYASRKGCSTTSDKKKQVQTNQIETDVIPDY